MIISSNTLATATRQLMKNIGPWLEKQCNVTADAAMGDELGDIVNQSAIGAAAAGLGVAWLPGAGSTASMVAMVGFIWSMYIRINKRIGLKLSRTLLKSLASAVLSNIAQAALTVVGSLALSTILSLTGVGSAASSIIMAALDYAVVMVGGIIYLKLLTGLFAAGKNPEDLTENELKSAVIDTIRDENVNEMLKNAKKSYSEARKQGIVNGTETVPEDKE